MHQDTFRQYCALADTSRGGLSANEMHRNKFNISGLLYVVHIDAAQSLVQLLHEAVDDEVMSQFVQTFLLESNSTAVRWQAHELLYSMHKYVHFLHCTWILWLCGGN